MDFSSSTEYSDASDCYPPTVDTYLPISEDIVEFATAIDSNDIEGFLFRLEEGTIKKYKSNYDSWMPNPYHQLEGRPIGFRILRGWVYEADGMLGVSMIYNECICPTTAFLADTPPPDIAVTASDGQVTQVIDF